MKVKMLEEQHFGCIQAQAVTKVPEDIWKKLITVGKENLPGLQQQ